MGRDRARGGTLPGVTQSIPHHRQSDKARGNQAARFAFP